MRAPLISALLSTCLVSCSTNQAPQPNILLVSVDTLRWDYLATYGYPDGEITPAVTWLASHGTVYERGVTNAGTTIPAHGTMLTGHYARVHGARSNFHGKYPAIPTVTQALAEAGYQTGAFLSNEFLFKVGKLGDGFQADNTPFRDRERGGRPQYGDKTIRQTIEWLDQLDRRRPFFGFVHLWEPHGPHDLTEWADQRMGDYQGPLREGMTLRHIHEQVRELMSDEANVTAMRTLYAGEVNAADQHLGRLFKHLENSGLLENTLVIFTADHGQSLGEFGQQGHGPVHRETVIRVPFIVADFRAPRAQRSETRVGLVDIAPTIADAAGLEQRFDFSGRSLLRADTLAQDFPYFVEVALRQPTDTDWEKTSKSNQYDAEALGVYVDELKLVFKHDAYRLFETAPDRLRGKELDLADEAVSADYLRGLIDDFRQTRLDLSVDEVSDEDLKVLQSLGYVQ